MSELSSSAEPTTRHKGIIAWFSANSVAANLLMIFIVVCGISSIFMIKVQIFPSFETQTLQITMAYPGAAPAEIEEAIVVPIEQALEGLSGIERIRSRANENTGSVSIQILADYNIAEMLDEVQNRVNAISTFPTGVERPIIRQFEVFDPVINISIEGTLDDRALKKLTQTIRDEIIALPGISLATIRGASDYEIAIEVSEQTLREYGLTLAQIASAIQRSSIDIPGGAIKTDSGRIQVRTKQQAYTGREYGNIVLRSNLDGTRLRIADIATINDGFVETEGFLRFDGKRALSISVNATDEQNVLDIEQTVSAYVEQRQLSLPAGVTMSTWQNTAYYLNSQLNMMLSNMALGALLVFIVLSIFLRIKVAAWVMVGIPISFLGALWLMPLGPMPVNINVLSLFGLILVLGIVVDDAIIIGESIFTEVDNHGHSLDNIIAGVHRVSVPATFGVLTTIAAFAPMLFVGGVVSSFLEAIGVVVILCLLFSLVESKLILPAHLAHTQFGNEQRGAATGIIGKVQDSVALYLKHFIHNSYLPTLENALHNRYTVCALFIGTLILSIGLIAGNWVKVEIFPNIPSDVIVSEITLNEGISSQQRDAALLKMEQAILSLQSENPDEKIIDHLLVRSEGDSGGMLMVELPKIEQRSKSPSEVEQLWRARVGEIDGAKEVRYYSSTNLGGGAKINLQLSGNNYEQLERAATELEKKLASYQGVFDVNSSYSRGADEISLQLKEDGRLLGITAQQLGAQVQHAFYGYEAQRILRGEDELKVMVRYPLAERGSIHNLENMRIRTETGNEVPFAQVAKMSTSTALSTINRIDRQRTVSVSGDINPKVAQSIEVISDISKNFVPQLLKRYPDVSYRLGGSSQEQAELTLRIIRFFFVALLLIYTLLAIPLKSYVQPLMVMAVIPFGFIGALIGHILFDTTVSMMSLFGLVALAGVIVNDSLILVDFVNRERLRGIGLHQSVLNAGSSRFRAILLTTLTTFFGLLPMVFETSMQAQLLIPMALSLAFGIVFGTALTLLLIPCLYLILEDIVGSGDKTSVAKEKTY